MPVTNWEGQESSWEKAGSMMREGQGARWERDREHSGKVLALFWEMVRSILREG